MMAQIVHSRFPSTSAHFHGLVGEIVSPEDFSTPNYLIDEALYDYEADWAFCYFPLGDVHAARFGFGRGRFDARDYGAPHPTPKSFLFLHVELMTAAGALLWRTSQRFTADQVQILPDRLDVRLDSNRGRLLHISGWPTMCWHVASDDGEIEVSACVDLAGVAILPDSVLSNNLFSMWLATGDMQGRARYKDCCWELTGTMFYDHPRVVVRENDARPFGWYIYTPMRFADGGCLAGYYMCDAGGRPVPGYCFGLYIDPSGRNHWLEQVQLDQFGLGAEGQPAGWGQHWQGQDIRIVTEATVRQTRVLRAWGDPGVALVRAESDNIPLVFDVQATITRRQEHHSVTGGGVAESLVHPDLHLADLLRISARGGRMGNHPS